MSDKYIFAVVGGDSRQVTMIKKLIRSGHCVKTFSLNIPSPSIMGVELSSSLEKAIRDCDVLLLPLPVSKDGKNLNLTAPGVTVPLEEIIRLSSKNESTIIAGGLINDKILELSQSLGIEIIDYYKSEELQQKNALPSAEGAIMLAMENTDRVIEGMNVLICGYGRIGKILAEKLKLLGASVSVAARRDEIICETLMRGYTPVKTTSREQMIKSVANCDVIFNTVPQQIFTKQIIDGAQNDPLYIEIASHPGGIDIPYARDKGLRLLFAPSLPGKYAPSSAGEYIYETLKDILDKRGMDI